MTDGHLDATDLAEYDEGLLSPPRASQVESHLAECTSCTAVLEQLGQVRARLADLPAEITMPAAVATRIDDALAHERAQPDREVKPERMATVHPIRRRLPRLLAAAATVAAVGFAGYVVAVSGSGNDAVDADTSAEGAAETGGGDESGAGGNLEEEAAGGQAAPEPAPDERTALTEQIEGVASAALTSSDASAPQRLADDCGLVLADELGAELIGVAGTDVAQPGAVLVVVEADQPDVAAGYVLPDCGAGAAEALRQLTVPIE
jgi:hypothetical protein